ncbi:P-loop NTPase family protein [Galactobacter caseinivorans]|uniref:AAA family ATPase n=1 Tax=Galactobacter caseinivorans TaxID=2676123 RepID=A0A496PHY0_9MICC|nr:AAA family ATPase [Galactobacter caseinivorans]RKW70082.1 AAA family ATPase [Galactobacter caseinivorans]
MPSETPAPAPGAPSRILVAGTSGSGKSTVARRVAAERGLPYTELDAVHWLPGWKSSPTFMQDVAALAGSEQWVTEWGYASVRQLLLERAELILWVDTPTLLTLWRVIRRTVSRRVHRTPVCNGNVEPPLLSIFTDPEHIVRWSWRTRHATREMLAAARSADPTLLIVRLRRRGDLERWLRGH